MAVEGLILAWRTRDSALTSVKVYGEFVLREILPNFFNLDIRANDIARAEYERIGSQPVIEDCDIDMASAAEAAQDKSQSFYDMMIMLRQSMLNLFAAG